jgi:hypothetical protein
MLILLQRRTESHTNISSQRPADTIWYPLTRHRIDEPLVGLDIP